MPLGKLAPVAQQQLAAWEKIAKDWPMYEDGWCYRCASCHINVIRLCDRNGVRYVYDPAELLTLTVAHLRQAHLDLDPDR